MGVVECRVGVGDRGRLQTPRLVVALPQEGLEGCEGGKSLPNKTFTRVYF